MAKDKYELELVQPLRRLGYFTRDNRVAGRYMPDPNSPDILAVGTYGIQIEYKTGFHGTFAFKSWTDGQRQFAVESYERGVEYWLGITFETPLSPHPHRKGKRKKDKQPRVSYILPASVLFTTIDKSPYLSIPYAQTRKKGLDAQTEWAIWWMDWTKGGWQFPKGHPFLKMYPSKRLVWKEQAWAYN